MNKNLVLILLFFGWSLAQAENIRAVLERSAITRLEEQNEVKELNADAIKIKKTIEAILKLETSIQLEIKIVEKGANAEAIMGKYLLVSKNLGQLSDGELTFILAHELGHVRLNHWQQFYQLYEEIIPGEIGYEVSKENQELLGRRGHEQALLQEYEADAFSYRLIKRLGYGIDDAVAAVRRSPNLQGDASHPPTSKRIMQLRMIDAN